MTGSAESEVLAAARRLVEVFGAHDTAGYFGSFAPDASFLFHNTEQALPDRAAYEELWASWERDGFRVEGCRSLEPRVQLLTGDVAVFTHRVRTRLAGEPDELRERETIVFRREPDGRWLGVHEHLSVDPA